MGEDCKSGDSDATATGFSTTADDEGTGAEPRSVEDKIAEATPWPTSAALRVL